MSRLCQTQCKYHVTTIQQSVKCVKTNWNKANYQYSTSIKVKIFEIVLNFCNEIRLWSVL